MVLVVDAAAMAGSVAAVVHGFATLDPARAAWPAWSSTGSARDGHEAMLREALAPLGVPVLGALRRDDGSPGATATSGSSPWPSSPTRSAPPSTALAAAVADAGRPRRRRRPGPRRRHPSPATGRCRRPRAGRAGAGSRWPPGRPSPSPTPTTLDAAGGRRAPRSCPSTRCADARLPDARSTALVAGGGFPEVHGEALAANAPLLADVRGRVGGGLPTWAECGGLLWLARSLDGRPMAGVVPADAPHDRPAHPRLPHAPTTLGPSPIGPAGTTLRGHEFHYSTIDPPATPSTCAAASAPGRRASPRRRCWPPTSTTTPAATQGRSTHFLATCRRRAGPRGQRRPVAVHRRSARDIDAVGRDRRCAAPSS